MKRLCIRRDDVGIVPYANFDRAKNENGCQIGNRFCAGIFVKRRAGNARPYAEIVQNCCNGTMWASSPTQIFPMLPRDGAYEKTQKDTAYFCGFLQCAVQPSQQPLQPQQLCFLRPRSRTKPSHAQTSASSAMSSQPIAVPQKSSSSRYSAAATHHATRHWNTATSAPRKRPPSSRPMAAMAATQGV